MYTLIHHNFFAYLDGKSKKNLLLTAYILVGLLAYLDYLAGDFSLLIFYFIPVFLVGWFVGKSAVFSICISSSIASYFDKVMDHMHSPSPYLLTWGFFLETSYLVLLGLMFSTLREKHDQETQLARIDPLTRVLNRRYLYEMAEWEINRSHRYNRAFSVAYLDLDNFKIINDQKGHHVGDNLLCVVAETIVDNVRCTDIVARIGGDEFVVILPETGEEDACAAIGKLQDKLMEQMTGRMWPVSFSIGLVTYNIAPASVDDMLKKADALMYSVKTGGKDGFKHEVIDSTLIRELPVPPKAVRWLDSRSGLFTSKITSYTSSVNEVRNRRRDVGKGQDISG